VIFNPTLYDQQRTYIMCPISIAIGTVDLVAAAGGNFAAVGGDFPLIVINPNLHIKCLVPGTCTFQGGQEQIATLQEDTSLVALFVQAAAPGLSLPVGYALDTSNLLIEGMIFTQSNDDFGESVS
jgi:hypothetical protein